jgi:hypothetical protein
MGRVNKQPRFIVEERAGKLPQWLYRVGVLCGFRPRFVWGLWYRFNRWPIPKDYASQVVDPGERKL